MNCLWSITGLRRLVGAARVHACVPTSAPTPAGVGTRAGSWAIASRAFESLAQPGSRGRFSRGAGGGDSDSDTEASQQQQQQQQQLGYSASQFRYFHEHAIKLLADREHGQGELRQKLVNLCFQKRRRLLRRLERRQQRNPRWNIKTPPETDCGALADAVLEALVERNYVDDARFAEWFVRQREEFRPRSLFHLRGELRQKHVDPDVIETVLEHYDEYSACVRLADKKRLWNRERQKRAAYLARQGFPWSVISAVEADHAQLVEEEAEREE